MRLFLSLIKISAIIYSVIWALFLLVFLVEMDEIGLFEGIAVLVVLSIPAIPLLYFGFFYKKEERKKKVIQTPVNEAKIIKEEKPVETEIRKTSEISMNDKYEEYVKSNTLDEEKEQVEHLAVAKEEITSSEKVEGKATLYEPVVTEEIAASEVVKKVEEKIIEEPQTVEEKETEPVSPPQPQYEYFSFNVAGVTMKNDKKRDIQNLLKRKGKLYCEENHIDLYGGWTNKEILDSYVEVYEFEDLMFNDDEISFVPEPTNEYDPNAIKVFINFDGEPDHIGYVPKKENKKLKEIIETKEVVSIIANYVGGKYKEVDYDFEKDKDVVVTNSDKSLGVVIKIAYKDLK